MKSYKVNCKVINDKDEEVEHTVFVKDAKDEENAEYLAKCYMTLEQTKFVFLYVINCVEI